jgi:exodeoxyribonuclease V alpha subunit
LAILNGGVGVGKTTTVRAVVALWEALGGRVEMCALAGNLRVSQDAGHPARTIHGLLLKLPRPNDPEPANQPGAPRLDARTLLVVGESSTVNLGQWHRLVQAMEPGCRLLAVGDVSQLPPFGFGLVFHVLAQIPSITSQLRVVHRQAESSGIPAVSGAVREGFVPALPQFQGKADGVFILPCPRGDIPRRIEEVAAVGSHADRIVVILDNQERLHISWAYTVITRAKRQVVLVPSDVAPDSEVISLPHSDPLSPRIPR